MKKHKGHQRELAHEFKAMAEESYNELHSQYPKTARAMASLGTLVPSLVDRVPSLTSPFFKHHGRKH
jgi:hypothetical protein